MFTQPVYTVLLAHFLIPGERLTPARAGGILLSLAGLLAVFGERLAGGSWTMLLGDGLVTAAAVGWALQSVYMKLLVYRTDPFVLSWLLLGDPITLPLLAGLVLVTGGIALVNRPRPAGRGISN